MLGFITKRFINFLLMVLIASSMGYFLASVALYPRGNYEAANPPIPKESIDAVLNRANVNDEVLFTTRYVKWAGNVLQGDFGEDLEQNRINEEFSRRVWVSLRLLLLGTILGATIGVIRLVRHFSSRKANTHPVISVHRSARLVTVCDT